MEQQYYHEAETMPRAELRNYQEHRFLDQVRHAYAHSPFYRRKFAAAGITADDIRGLIDLPKLPFSTKDDIKQSQQEHPPWGDILAVSPREVLRVHLTSGTTGQPTPVPDTREDWVRFYSIYARDLYAFGIREHDMVLPAFSFGPWVGFWAGFYAAEAIGCTVFPTGGMSTDQRIDLLLRYPITVLGCTPSYALYLAEQARKKGIDLAREAHVRITWHTGEPGASIPGTKQRIEEAYGARCFDLPGVTEIGPWGFECRAQPGVIHVNEDWAYPEVLSPVTGEPVRPGEKGELVFTLLQRRAIPLLRYRTRDLVQVSERSCPCGRTLMTLDGGILGRLDDLKKIRGVIVYPSRIEEVVRKYPEVDEYLVRILRVDGLDEIRVELDPAPALGAEGRRRLATEMAADLKLTLGIRVEVTASASGSLKRWDHKARRVVDERTEVPF